MAGPHLLSSRFLAVQKFVEGWNALDLDPILGSLSDDAAFQYHLLPKSLQKDPMNKQEYGEYAAKIIRGFKGHQITPIECIDASDRAIIHAHAHGTSTTGGQYTNEIVLIFTLDQQGKIVQVKEFVDIFTSSMFFADEVKRRMGSDGCDSD